MTYAEFYDMFKNYLTGRQIADMQEVAFTNYADAHGYRPIMKRQKQFAYDFIRELFYGMELDDCIDYLDLFGVPEHIAIDFYIDLKRNNTEPEQKQERQFTYDEGFEDGIQAGKDECLDILTQMLNSGKYDSNTIQAAIEAIENN